jgi:hypothetical protein
MPVNAHTFLQRWNSFSRPVALKCDDDREYVVKSRCTDRQMDRALVNEQVVGYLALLLAAPVPLTAQVNVPHELIGAEPQMQHMRPGIAHAALRIPDCSDKTGIDLANVAANRARFGALSILFGWAGGGDQQLIYANTPPRLVYSVDHGHFFPNGPDWTVQNLEAAESESVGPHPYFAACGLGEADYHETFSRLAEVSAAQIATAVALPPDDWRIDLQTRVSLATFLAKRRDTLLQHYKKKEEAHG